MAEETERGGDAIRQEQEMREHEREAREREASERPPDEADRQPAPPGNAQQSG